MVTITGLFHQEMCSPWCYLHHFRIVNISYGSFIFQYVFFQPLSRSPSSRQTHNHYIYTDPMRDPYSRQVSTNHWFVLKRPHDFHLRLNPTDPVHWTTTPENLGLEAYVAYHFTVRYLNYGSVIARGPYQLTVPIQPTSTHILSPVL